MPPYLAFQLYMSTLRAVLAREIGGSFAPASFPLGANNSGSSGSWLASLSVLHEAGLSNSAWTRVCSGSQMAPLIIVDLTNKGSTGCDNRMFVEGVLWIVRTGSPWA